MNKDLHKIIFSKVRNAYVVVSEIASSVSGGVARSSCTSARAASTFGTFSFVVTSGLTLSFMLMASAWAAPAVPKGGAVTQGNVAISQSGNVMTVNQSSDKAIVNWQSFSIGTGAAVNIVQPSASSTHLSRVTGNDPSVIQGQLQSNGQVVLVNPNGIVVGKDGSVSANSFTASTLNITDADFMAGKYQYARNGANGEVINQGKIETAAGGYVALLGAKVTNEGTITSQQGAVYLGAGDAVAVPVTGSGRIKFEVSPAAINTSVNNNKDAVIVAEGGQVYMRAASLNDLAVASVQQTGSIDVSGAKSGNVTVLADKGQIKATGTIKANSTGTTNGVPNKGGNVIIGRDLETGVLAASTDVSGAQLQAKHGFVETSGSFLVTTGTRVQAKDWLLDPTNITIASGTATGVIYNSSNEISDSVILASDISANLTDGTSVIIATSASGSGVGNISVNESISKTGGVDATLTLKAHGNIIVAANKTISSNTGKLNVIFKSDSDGIGGGGISFYNGSGITSNGGDITLGGGGVTGFAIADGVSTIQGIALFNANINAGGGNIVMNGKTARTDYQSSLSNVAGILMSGGAISTTGSGYIQLTGKNQNTNTISRGLAISGGTVTGGSAGEVTIIGDSRDVGSTTFSYIRGVELSGVIESEGNINIEGYGGAGTISDNGVDIRGSVKAYGSGVIKITGTANAGGSGQNIGVRTSGAGKISSENGNITVTGFGGPGSLTILNNHGVQISGVNAIESTGLGKITISGDVKSPDSYSKGVDILGSVKAANNLEIFGNQNNPSEVSRTGVGVNMSGTGTIVSGKNVTINGNSDSGNGILLSGATLSAEYINALGATNTGYTGFAWQGGNIRTTGTAGTSRDSIIKGTSAASSTGSNGYGAFMMFGNGSVSAVTDTKITLAGNASKLETGKDTRERGILVQGGRTLNASGNIILDGSSQSSEGISFGGTINMGSDVNVTNNLTIKGTTTASSSVNKLNAMNFSGVINGSNTTNSINFIGDARSGSIIDNAIKISGLIDAKSSNINVQSLNGKIELTNNPSKNEAISGNNISIKNTDDSINASTGEINEGSIRHADTDAIRIDKALNASGNVNVLSQLSNNTHTGLTLTEKAPITSDGKINLVTDGRLSLGSVVSTTNSTESAIILIAGKSEAARTRSGGDVVISGIGGVSLSSATARATIYSGSVLDSTGVTSLVESGSGRFRYGHDEAPLPSYIAPLGQGVYAIYREAPDIEVTLNSATKIYDAQTWSGPNLVSATGLKNGDLAPQQGLVAYVGAALSAVNVGNYAIEATAVRNALGYNVSKITKGDLEITKAPLTITGANKTVNESGLLQVNSGATVIGAKGSDAFNVSGYASGLSAGTTADNLSVTGVGSTLLTNYNIQYVNGAITIVAVNPPTPTSPTTTPTTTPTQPTSTTIPTTTPTTVSTDNNSSTRSSPTFTGTSSAQTSTAAARNAVVIGGGAQGGEFQLASAQECGTEACVCEVSDFDKSVELCYEEDIPSARSRVSSR